MSELKTNVLYYGDNLDILRNREHFPDESIDLMIEHLRDKGEPIPEPKAIVTKVTVAA